MVALYCTADSVGVASGGGAVTMHELQAMREVFGDVLVLSQKELQKEPDQSPFLYDYFALARVRELHRKLYIDFAHFYSGTFTETVKHLKSEGVPVSYTCPFHSRALTVEEFQRAGMVYPYRHISDDALWAQFFRGVREADFPIAPSHESARLMRAEGCSLAVTVIPHGCDWPEQEPDLPPVFNVGYLGQVGPDKGLVYALRAWGSLGLQGSTFVIAGAGSENLAHLIAQQTPGGRFQLLGYVKAPVELYKRCSVYIQPSVCEAFGIEVLEAMAHGRPVIVSSGAGASELVSDGEDGFVVPARDPDAIANRISWFLQDQGRVWKMGRKARAKARGYLWLEARNKYKELWKQE